MMLETACWHWVRMRLLLNKKAFRVSIKYTSCLGLSLTTLCKQHRCVCHVALRQPILANCRTSWYSHVSAVVFSQLTRSPPLPTPSATGPRIRKTEVG